MTQNKTDIIATISASQPRRWLGVLSMVGLGLLLIYVALAKPPALGWLVFLLMLGAGSLWLGVRMWDATSRVIELTEDELRDNSGAVIARIADIEQIDRGFFAFKPSNGFLIRTCSAAGKSTWQPGLWWRSGRRIGIGGVTPGSQSKFVAEYLQTMIAMRDIEES
ncbi:hypothetical protein E4Z66_11450 [Aliishimia ponticola]|uniref:DUF2244 domain-containing protein n=1 Tax=Aliishimia ponticola TaxID=2499833 RepID=A0A4S4NCB7_9RHOB|nr:hypothetical protein [Aliishimia ponticola]THH35698.1 hypothetical protein E4Z66_11450 [Aliishimia ponticola]